MKKILAVALFAFLFAVSALAQSTYGTLLGSVKDQTEARVQNATVTVTEVNTHISNTAKTSELGTFEIPNLLPGLYDVVVQADGFKKLTHRGVILEARAQVRVDSTLQVGAMQTSVEVKAPDPVTTTETATVSDAMGGAALNDLPANFRAVSTSPVYLITNLPGVVVDNSFGGSDLSISGSHPVQNEFAVDGFSVISVRSNGPNLQMFPSSEMVSEMRVTSEAAPAEFGQIANITFTTKGGDDKYRGTLFEYLQNTDLNARNYFATSRATINANDFGGSFSGPVRLPHYNGKNRTFFFFDYEANRQPSQATEVNSVPTQAMIGGDFSALCATYDATGKCSATGGIQIKNPFTGVFIPNNKITSGISTVSTKMLALFYPLPNQTLKSAGNITNDYVNNDPQKSNTSLFDIRIDQKFSDKQSLNVRYSWSKVTKFAAQSLLQGQVATIPEPQTLGLSYTYSITQNLLNEFRFGMTHMTNNESFPSFANGQSVVSGLGLLDLPTIPHGSGYPSLSFSGASGITGVGGGREEPQNERRFQTSDNLTWIHRRHTIKTGVDIRHEQFRDYVSSTYPDMYGTSYFNGTYTGYDIADFLMGLPNQEQTFYTPGDTNQVAFIYGAYGQDAFQINSRLTVNFGLRYEYHPPFHDTLNNVSNFDPATGNVVVQNAESLKLTGLSFEQGMDACGWGTYDPPTYAPTAACTNIVDAKQDGIPSSLRWASKLMFMPRLGFAYRISDKTVARVGGGIYDSTMLGRVAYSGTGNNTSDFRGWNNSITGGVPLFQFPDTRPAATPSCAGCPAGNLNFGTATAIHLRDPYAMQWSATVERDLGWHTGLRVTYTGMHTIGLIEKWDRNEIPDQAQTYNPAERPFPNFQQLQMRSNIGSQMFNSMENVVTHRFNSGLTFQSSLIWTKSLSDAEGDNNNTSGFPGETGNSVDDAFNIKSDRGNVSFARRLRSLTTNTWEIPVGRGKRFGGNMGRALDAAVGGWQMNNILILQTGPFITPYYSSSHDPSGTNAPNRVGSQRPDRLPLSACSAYTTSQARPYRDSCFYFGWTSAIGRWGNSGVGIYSAAGTINWDSGLAKSFTVYKQTKLRFEATGSNVLNHVNMQEPSMKVQSSSFGTISSTQGAEQEGQRTIQLALKLMF